MIAVANGANENATSTIIYCYRVSVKLQFNKLVLSSERLPSFFVGGGAVRDISSNLHVHFVTVHLMQGTIV